MKFRKTLGVLLTMLGCIAAFLGLAASVLPLLANAQLQLVLDSFATPSQSFLVNGINHLMTFVLNRPLPVLLGGVLAAAGGIALLACAGSKPRRNPDEAFSRPAPRFSEEIEKQAGLWRPRQAENVLPDNPFAAPSMEDGLAAGQGGWRGGSFREIREERANTFAPAAQSHAAAFASVKPDERSPYQRPKTQEPRSPYQRPEAQERSPYQRPEEPEPFNRSDDSFLSFPAPTVEEEADASPSLSSIFEEDLLFTRSQASQTAAHSEKPAEKAEEPAPDFDLTFESDEAEDSLFFPTVSPEAKSNSEPLTTPVIDEPLQNSKAGESKEAAPMIPAAAKQKVKIRSTMGKHTC